MIYLRIACKKHPKYLGHMKPRAGWYRTPPGRTRVGGPCPGCTMVYSARHDREVTLTQPWVKYVIVRKP